MYICVLLYFLITLKAPAIIPARATAGPSIAGRKRRPSVLHENILSIHVPSGGTADIQKQRIPLYMIHAQSVSSKYEKKNEKRRV